MKRYRIKCPYCDGEFEYSYGDTYVGNSLSILDIPGIPVRLIHCLYCGRVLVHQDSSPSNNITTEQL